jgi:hypothetical protein
MTLKREYDNMPGEFKHLIANSDSEIAELEQAAHPAHIDIPPTAQLTPRESAALRQQIETNALVHDVLGLDSESVLRVDAKPLGANGKPLSLSSKAKSMEELERDFQSLVKAVTEGVERGDPESLAIVQSGRDRMLAKGSTEHFKRRMAEAADEFAPEVASFVKAWVAGDDAAMRKAVRPIAEEMLVAEA